MTATEHAEKRSERRKGGNTLSFSVAGERDNCVLAVRGEWSAQTVGLVERRLRSELAEHPPLQAVDMQGVTRLDTTGALLLLEALGLEKNTFITDNPQHRRLLAIAGESPGPRLPDTEERPALGMRFLNELGETIVQESRLAIQIVGFLGEYLVTCAQILIKPKTLPFTSLVYHMQQVGVTAVPIVALLAFLIGLVIAYMGAQQLAMFGAEIFTIKLVEITTLRELGVLLTSIVIAGRSGSSFTAQIGAMVANEEVAAMRVMGLSPMARLVFPRITALIIMLPALVFLANLMSLLGGGLASFFIMNMAPESYAARMQADINLNNLLVGMVKAPFFAVIIGTIGCFQGFQVTGSAESVGRLTTHSVVEAIFMVIACDALFALFFTGLGI